MDLNLDKIAVDLYDKLKDRFTDIKFGDQEATVLPKEEDVPQARFFEFPYKDRGVVLGTVTINLDSDDGLVVKIGGDLAAKKHPGVLKFLKGLRKFANVRLIKFDLQNIGKNNLDKRDYQFHAKRKEELPMDPIMENKLFGTAKISYQDLGEATLIIKHSQPVNTELAAGRTMHIDSIYVENAQGERFKYPFKHINGARALAEHIKAGGNPYDSIGKHITSLSEELAQLRKFKGYVSRNESLSEAMGDITNKVMERIEAVKKEVSMLQRPAYYEQFAESFEDREDQMIPEDIMSDWIDRLTIRTFNEELKTAFPYIFRLVDESEIPVKSISPDDLLDEVFDGDKEEGTTHKGGKVTKKDGVTRHEKTDYDDGNGQQGAKKKDSANSRYKKYPVPDPEEQFESFMDRILEDQESQEGSNTLFSPNLEVRGQAIKNLKKAVEQELPAGEDGLTAIQSLKGIIDSPELESRLQSLSSGGDDDIDARGTIKDYLNDLANGNVEEPESPEAGEIAKELLAQNAIPFDGEGEIGGQDMDQPPPEAAPLAPPPAPAAPPAPPEAVPAPLPAPGAVPPAPVAESNDDLPFDGPYKKSSGNVTDKSGAKHTGHSQAKHLAHTGLIKAIHKAKQAGADLDTKLDFGHKEMTLHDCIEECGMHPDDFGFEPKHNPLEDMWKRIEGFWDGKKFTTGGTRAKIIIIKGFNNDEFPGAEPSHVKHVMDMIERMDPTSDELGHIRHLSGMHHEQGMEEGTAQEDLAAVAKAHPELAPMIQKILSDPNAKFTQSNTSSGTVNGKPAAYNDAMKQMPKINFGGQDFDLNNPDDMGEKIKGMMGNMMKQHGSQIPNQNVQFPGGQMNPQDMFKGIMGQMGMQESDELSAMLKIAGVKK
jgi:hypothetical protein